jgi:RND family efflux transporter MFP subunit
MTFALTGSIAASENVPMGFRSGGKVIGVAVDIGDRVEAGQLLAQVDAAQAEAAERAANAQLAAAEAGLRQAQQARDRADGLAQRGAGTRAELDAADEALISARSLRDQADAALAKARQAVRDTRLVAPVAGIVTGRMAEPGQVVAAAQTVVSIARDGLREAVFHAPDTPDLEGFLGRSVPLRSFDVPPVEARATVTEISPLADPDSGTVEVRARIGDGPAALGLGTAVASEVALPQGTAVSLPWSAVVTQGAGPAVWVIDPATMAVQLTPVTVAFYTSSTVEVARGIADGAMVVTEGANLLFPGRIVRLTGESP